MKQKLYDTIKFMDTDTLTVYEVDNITKFAEEFDINVRNLYNLKAGKVFRAGKFILVK